MTIWTDINQVRPPIGETILMSNSKAKITTVGVADWQDGVAVPIYTACDPKGFGRFKPTHWAHMPEAAE